MACDYGGNGDPVRRSPCDKEVPRRVCGRFVVVAEFHPLLVSLPPFASLHPSRYPDYSGGCFSLNRSHWIQCMPAAWLAMAPIDTPAPRPPRRPRRGRAGGGAGMGYGIGVFVSGVLY